MMKRRRTTLICLLVVTSKCDSFYMLGSQRARTTLLGSQAKRREVSPRFGDDDNDDYWEDDDDLNLEDDDDDEYKTSFQVPIGTYEEEEPEWEECVDDENTWVLLPPSYVNKPTAVLHFVGGTLFGSSPKDWYGTLLEGLVQATHCTIVATAIPVTLVENPLQHVTLSRKVQKQFQSAYVKVLEDEYGPEVLQNVPVIALGHSLGARLLTVLATLAPPKNAAAPPYKTFILMSFTNFGASASIPGVQQLVRSRRTIDSQPSPPPPSSRKRRRYRRNAWDDWDDDEELEEMLDDLQESVWKQTTKVRDALTPHEENLEFYPSPDQLWDALTTDKRYNIPQTLLIQFDDDEIDQSAKLAMSLINTSDLKYALLKGTHLSPIDAREGGWLNQATRATKMLWKAIQGSKMPSKRKKSSDDMIDLRQTIARYITDVATKE